MKSRPQITDDIGPYAIIPEWVLDATSPAATRLYAILGTYVNRTLECWPSRRLLAERMGCSERTLDRAKDELVDLGALIVTPQFSEKGDRTSNLYHLVRSLPRGVGSKPPPRVGSEQRQELDPIGTRSLQEGGQGSDEPAPDALFQLQGQEREERPRDRLIGGFADDWETVTKRSLPRRFRGPAAAAVDAALAEGESESDIAICLGVMAREGKAPNRNNLLLVLADKHAGRPRRQQRQEPQR